MTTMICMLQRMFAILALSAACGFAAPANTVSLTASEPTFNSQPGGPLLVRELFRQAVLIAARDELHASTRDQTLREALDPTPFDIAVNCDAPISAKLTRGDETIWEAKANLKNVCDP